MKNVYPITEFKDYLIQLRWQLRQQRHRAPLWMQEPDPEACLLQTRSVALLQHWMGDTWLEQALWLTPTELALPNRLLPQHYSKILGKEWPAIVIDARQGLRANVLAAASGGVAAGGLLIIITTELDAWLKQNCTETRRLFGETQIRRGFFLPRLVKLYQHRFCWVEVEQEQVVMPANWEPLPALSGLGCEPLLESYEQDRNPLWLEFPEQQQVIAAIKKVFTGHARRPCVITADRGRGKSSAIGKALAELVSETDKSFVITAPSPEACQQLLSWFTRLLPENLHNRVQFIAPDELIRRLQVKDIAADGVVVDEAAAIPVALLRQLLGLANRLVFATTVHGYEGNGRGFAIRFTAALNELMPQWQAHQLTQPIRWNAHDPLEEWVGEALLLGQGGSGSETDTASLATRKPRARTLPRNRSFNQDLASNPQQFLKDRFRWLWIEPAEPIDDLLLEQAFGLLVESHYQTTPDDLRQFMDHPDRTLLLAIDGSQVVGVTVMLKEGGLSAELADAVSRGRRRLRGQLTPQTLAFHLQMPALARFFGWRIQRIAVAAEWRRQGLGKSMLRFIEDRASKLKLHYLASCFAASADLMPFWLGAGYWPARLGVTRDKASGCHSLLVLKPLLDDDAWRLLQKRFYRTTEKLLAARFRLLEPELVVQLWSGCSEAVTLSEWDWQRITAFARGELLLEESVDAIDGLLRLAMHQLRLHSSASEQDSMAVQILVAAIWQWRDARELEALYGVNGKRSLRQFLQLHVQRIVDRIAADGRVTD